MASYSDIVPGINLRPTDESATETPGISSTDASTPQAQNVATSHRQIPSFIRKLGSGLILDVRARIPWYLSDWTDAWNYRVIPATALIFFAKYVSEHCTISPLTNDSVLPGIAFSLDLIETTQQYGVTEVLVSSFMAAFVFSVFGAQPLTIAGVTGQC